MGALVCLTLEIVITRPHFAFCFVLFCFIFPHLRTFFHCFLEGEEGKERNIDGLPPIHAWTRDQTHKRGVCPDWELNTQSFGHRSMLQPTEPRQPGHTLCSLLICSSVCIFHQAVGSLRQGTMSYSFLNPQQLD